MWDRLLVDCNIATMVPAPNNPLGVIENGAMANTYTTDFNDRAVKDLARDTMQIVQVSNTDKFNGLAPKERS